MKRGGPPTLNDDDAESVRVALRRLLADEGATITSLAEQIGISQPSLSQILSGQTRPSVQTAISVALVAGLRVSSLVPALMTPFGPPSKKYPSKTGAAVACLECGVPFEAVRMMMADDPDFLDRDPGARWWFGRAENFAAGLPAAPGELPSDPAPKALPPPKGRKRSRSH